MPVKSIVQTWSQILSNCFSFPNQPNLDDQLDGSNDESRVCSEFCKALYELCFNTTSISNFSVTSDDDDEDFDVVTIDRHEFQQTLRERY